MAGWDAENYARKFSFVPEYGRELITLLAPQRDEKILDLGCGTGSLTAEIAATGADVTGCDRDANMIALAIRTHPELPFFQQDAEKLSLKGPFDAVFSNAALHWMNIAKVFPEVAQILKTKGRFVAEMGGIRNIATVEKAIYQALDLFGVTAASAPTAWHFRTPGECARELEHAGFEVRYMHLYDRMTLLKTESGGLRGWIKMFAGSLLAHVPEGKEDEFLDKVEVFAKPDLYRDGEWWADYRRQHFIAVKR